MSEKIRSMSFRVRLILISGFTLLLAGWFGLVARPIVAADALPPQNAPPNSRLYHVYLPSIVSSFAAGKPELGDAPDSTNNFGVLMTAYPSGGPPGTIARFPTVYKTGSPPFGPIHRNMQMYYHLGPAITAETEADSGPDVDGSNNIQPLTDAPDQDKADDGIAMPLLPHCTPTTLTYIVTVPAGAPASQALVNVWFDWDRNGAWGGIQPCAGIAAPEWAVQNHPIALTGPGTYVLTTPAFVPYNPTPNRCLWWRITLSGQPAAADDGSGPANGYEYGETEDYYQCGEVTKPTPTATATATATPACATPPFEMTAWWPLDEAAGPTAFDIAGFPTNGTHFNGPSPVPGKVNGALSFDGQNDYVEVANHSTLNFGQGNFSIDTWIRTGDASGVKLILDKRVEAASVQGYSLFLGNGLLAFQLADGVGSNICTSLPGASCTNYPTTAFVADGQWHHIAVTVNRGSVTGGRFYVDGALVATFDPTLHPGSVTNANPLRLASRSSSVSGLLRGTLDEVELFPRVLTLAEIQSIFLADTRGKCKPTPTPTRTPTSTRPPTSTPTPTPTATPTKKPPFSIIVLKLWAPDMTPLPDWRMTLFSGAECRGEPLAQLTTDQRGMVDFLDLAPGLYSVQEEQQPGFENLKPLCQAVELTDTTPTTVQLRSVAYPPPGVDTFPSGAELIAEINGVGPINLTLNGPTTVKRGAPLDSNGDGRMEIPTEILAMSLVAHGPTGMTTLTQSPTKPSLGQVVQQSPGVDFPADSFFDVFVELEVTGLGRLHNGEPLRMQTAITAIPPILAYYQTPAATAVPLLDANGNTVGILRYALHIPLPPFEKIIIFINHKPPTATPTATPTKQEPATATPTSTRPPTSTPTPTATPTKQEPPTSTPTATPTSKPVLTGVSSTFTQTADGQLQITIHVQTKELDKIVFDMEIFFKDQNPVWVGVQPVHGPAGWEPFPVPGGIGWVTGNNPLQTCQPVVFVVQILPGVAVGDFISIHLTDKDHQNLGNITSQRVRMTSMAMLNGWLPSVVACGG